MGCTYHELEHSRFWSNFEFDRNTVSVVGRAPGAWTAIIVSVRGWVCSYTCWKLRSTMSCSIAKQSPGKSEHTILKPVHADKNHNQQNFLFPEGLRECHTLHLLYKWRSIPLNTDVSPTTGSSETVTHCGLVTPYGDINLAQHWTR